MTRKPEHKNNGYALEACICMTPELESLHTHITVRMEAGCDSSKPLEVKQKAFEDFKAWLENPLGEGVKLSLENFLDSLTSLECFDVVAAPSNESGATHLNPGSVQ